MKSEVFKTGISIDIFAISQRLDKNSNKLYNERDLVGHATSEVSVPVAMFGCHCLPTPDSLQPGGNYEMVLHYTHSHKVAYSLERRYNNTFAPYDDDFLHHVTCYTTIAN